MSLSNNPLIILGVLIDLQLLLQLVIVIHQEKKKLRPEHLDAVVSGHFPSGCSHVRAFSFLTQLCQGIFLLDAAVSGHFPTGRVRTTYVILGCFTNGTIAQVVTNSLSPLSGQHLYDGSGATV